MRFAHRGNAPLRKSDALCLVGKLSLPALVGVLLGSHQAAGEAHTPLGAGGMPAVTPTNTFPLGGVLPRHCDRGQRRHGVNLTPQQVGSLDLIWLPGCGREVPLRNVAPWKRRPSGWRSGCTAS